MKFLRSLRRRPFVSLQALVSALLVALLAAADYYGFAVFGEDPEQQQSTSQSHLYRQFHK